MLLLSGHSLTPARKVPLEAMNLQLKERDSTATMTPADMTGISISSWFQDDTDPGKGIVWRVKSIGTAYATNTPTLNLEHAISILKDRVLFGAVTPATITGKSTATTCTAAQAVRYILGKQSDWVLGSFGYSVSNPYKFDGDTLFDALETVTNSLEDAEWTYDMSAYPFKLNIRPRNSTVSSELRAGRNLKTITRTVDKGGMYTRFYPIGKDALKLKGMGYVDKNASKYGIIEKVETDESLDSEEELKRFANERLKLHAEPTVTIDVEGLELSGATGEPLDRLTLGRVCRVPLPEFGTTIEERIVTLTYPDKLFQPTVFKATLANSRSDVTKIVADAIKQGGKSRRKAAEQSKEDHAWFEDTDEYVAMVATKTGIDKLGKSETLYSRLQVQADRITAEVSRAKEAEGTLSGKISVEAGKISQIVSSVGKDGKVTAASICLSINNGGSSAMINASKIYLLGQTIANQISADYIAAKIATIPTLNGVSAGFSGTVTAAGLIGSAVYVKVDGVNKNISGAILSLQITRDGNDYTLQKKSAQDTTWADVGTFSRAVTSWEMGWSNGKFTAKAKPQNQSVNTQIVQGTATHDGGTFTIPIEAIDSDNPGYQYATGRNVSLSFSTMSLTRAPAYRNASGYQYYGRLYYYDNTTSTYKAASDSDHYWYYSGTNRAGSNVVYY